MLCFDVVVATVTTAEYLRFIRLLDHLLKRLLLLLLLQELSPLGSRLLCGIRRQACWHVLALLQPVVLAPGQQLCWKGQPAECLWLMQV